MTTTSYQISGMTCGHCVSSVRSEVAGVPDVVDVQVDLASGRLTVTSAQPVATAQIEAAVEEAGYQLTP